MTWGWPQYVFAICYALQMADAVRAYEAGKKSATSLAASAAACFVGVYILRVGGFW